MKALAQKLKDDLRDKYYAKKVMISYSGGLDSTLLAWFMLNAGASEICLLNFDCGMENSPRQKAFYLSDEPRDDVYDIDQYVTYAETMERQVFRFKSEMRAGLSAYDCGYGNITRLNIPTIPLNGLAVAKSNILKADNPDTVEIEDKHGVKFYAGFVMLRLSSALAVAAARGYDYVLTGHLGWNTHYEDESQEFVDGINNLFRTAYGSRLRQVPRVEMPFRKEFDGEQVTKQTLIELNELMPVPYRSDLSISCSAALLSYTTKDGNKYPTSFAWRSARQDDYPVLTHCGHCAHCLDRKKSFEAAGVKDMAFFAE